MYKNMTYVQYIQSYVHFKDCLEMLMEKATCTSDVPGFFPFVSSTINDNITDESDTNNDDNQLSNPTSMDTNNEISIES